MVKIYDTDTPKQVAKKIYKDFDIHASASIYGFYTDIANEKIVPKGELVLEELRLMYEADQYENKAGKMVRKFQYRSNSIGGPIAHKIFTWEKRIVDSEPRYTIWRFQ
jgi:hypothetical protein